jgi:hypothetical protein
MEMLHQGENEKAGDGENRNHVSTYHPPYSLPFRRRLNQNFTILIMRVCVGGFNLVLMLDEKDLSRVGLSSLKVGVQVVAFASLLAKSHLP